MFTKQYLTRKKADAVKRMSLALAQIYAMGAIDGEEAFRYREALREYVGITGNSLFELNVIMKTSHSSTYRKTKRC